MKTPVLAVVLLAAASAAAAQPAYKAPRTWAEPWGGEYEFGKAKGAVYEYACHEGNYGLQNILAGARSDERTARAAAR